MKKRLYTIALAAICAASCYPSYVGDYETVAAGFANQTDVRSVVVGESMEFSTGIALGGAIENEETRRFGLGTDYSLVGDALLASMKVHQFSYIQQLMAGVERLQALPVDMYDVETESTRSGEACILKGSHLGSIVIRIDDSFLEDEGNRLPKYVIPLRITSSDGTDVIDGMDYTVIGVHYESKLFGYWYHGGKVEVVDGSGNLVGTTVYERTVPQADSKVWTLTTVAPYSVTANALTDGLSGSDAQMKLTLADDGSVTVEPVDGAPKVVEQDGECRFNNSKLLQDREIYLKYKYVSDGLTYHATDTLYFRNRIRDGVNEWQDENQNNYE